MESKFWLYAYVTLGGALLFAGGYYLGLSGRLTPNRSPKIVSDQKKKESEERSATGRARGNESNEVSLRLLLLILLKSKMSHTISWKKGNGAKFGKFWINL